jgi:hypothetical protein
MPCCRQRGQEQGWVPATRAARTPPKPPPRTVSSAPKPPCCCAAAAAAPAALHCLQAGLSALKTPLSLAEGCCREDPLHLPAFRALAEGLPSAKHVHSTLICALSHTLMNEHNPPAMLPNGYVYSQRALQEMAAGAGGRVTCPRTGFTCDASELRRVYIS